MSIRHKPFSQLTQKFKENHILFVITFLIWTEELHSYMKTKKAIINVKKQCLTILIKTIKSGKVFCEKLVSPTVFFILKT